MPNADAITKRRVRVRDICLALPEAEASSRTGQHDAYWVRGKKFAYYLDDHHGDGKQAINCKVPPGAMHSLVDAYPDKFFVPAYLGATGWVGLRVDLKTIDWGEIEALLTESYRVIAPKRLASQVA